MKNQINFEGFELLDTFVLNYYGILVFFQICKTTPHSVFLVELATKKYKNGIMLTKSIKASKNPLIISKNNTYTKSTYEVFPIKVEGKGYVLPIQIKYKSKLYQEACKRNEFPLVGTVYITPINIDECMNKYWANETETNENDIHYC